MNPAAPTEVVLLLVITIHCEGMGHQVNICVSVNGQVNWPCT
jgi:hypothetical protein